MEITISQTEGQKPITVMHVHGNVDSTSYEAFQARALESIENGARNLVIDLSEVPFMSSAGLRALNQIYNTLRDENATRSEVSAGVTKGTYKSPHLKLAAPTKRVMEMLKMSGFDMFLEIHPDLQSALDSF
jgi:anti-anti-sigma factor